MIFNASIQAKQLDAVCVDQCIDALSSSIVNCQICFGITTLISLINKICNFLLDLLLLSIMTLAIVCQHVVYQCTAPITLVHLKNTYCTSTFKCPSKT